MTKDDVINALKTRFLPLFDPMCSIAVAVAAPAKADEIREGLEALGFEVTQRVMEVDTIDIEEEESEDS